VLLSACFGHGLVTVANRAFDRSPRQAFTVTVEERPTRYATERRVRLSAWGPVANSWETTLPASLYQKATEGSRLCVASGSGALGVRWYELEGCEPAD
jgi:hypothetical protein